MRCSYGYIMYSTAAPTDQDVVESGLDGRSSCCATLSVYAILKAAPSAGLEPARETQPYLAFAIRTTFLPHPRIPIYTLYRPAVSTPPSSKFMTLPCYTTMLHNHATQPCSHVVMYLLPPPYPQPWDFSTHRSNDAVLGSLQAIYNAPIFARVRTAFLLSTRHCRKARVYGPTN